MKSSRDEVSKGITKTPYGAFQTQFTRDGRQERQRLGQADLDANFLMEKTEMMPIETCENPKRLTKKSSSKHAFVG